MKPRPEEPREVMRAIQSVKRVIGRDGESRIELRLWDKLRALEMAAKHLGIYEEAARPETPVALSVEQFRKLAGLGAELVHEALDE